MRKLFPLIAAAAVVAAGIAVATFPGSAVEGGMAKGVDPDAEAIASGASRTLKIGDDVSIGETIETGPTGQVQLLFDDATELVVGPGSSLRVDDYLVRRNGSAGDIAISALNGTFRFVTGSSNHDSYNITTPTGTIGVRGTAFDFSVLRQNRAGEEYVGTTEYVTNVVLYDGAVQLCSNNGECVILDDLCGFATGSTTQAALVDNTAQSRSVYRPDFPYANDQSPLLGAFWIQGARTCLNLPSNNQGGASGVGCGRHPRRTGGPDPTVHPRSLRDHDDADIYRRCTSSTRMLMRGRRLLATLFGLAIVFALSALRIVDPYPVQALREITFDFFQRLNPRPVADFPVRVVDIDETSLQPIGQWPWPRETIAQLNDRLAELGAAAIGYDVLFPEADRLGPAGDGAGRIRSAYADDVRLLQRVWRSAHPGWTKVCLRTVAV